MKDLGMMHYFLGLEVWQITNEIFLSHGKYTVEILKKFGMLNYKPMDTPMVMDLKKLSVSSFDSDKIDMTLYKQLIGSLMYIVNTKLDIFYAMSALIQFMSHSRKTYWIFVKHVLRYLRGTIGHGIRYTSSIGIILQGYTDSDWVGITVDKKSTSACFFTLESAMVSWCSRKHTFGLSTVEVEYIALSVAFYEAVWPHKILVYLFVHVMDSTIIHRDNQSCVNLSKNPMFHDKSKHIEIKYHYIR
jgi:hypothetical protein